MLLREWKYEDILKIAELEKECFTDPWTYRMFADAFSSDFFYGILAEEDGALVGYACETVLFENAEVDNVAVREDCRRRGIGTALLEALKAEAQTRGARVMLLEARVSNVAALSAYLRCGFRGIAVRARYYPDGEDALVMQKKIGEDG